MTAPLEGLGDLGDSKRLAGERIQDGGRALRPHPAAAPGRLPGLVDYSQRPKSKAAAAVAEVNHADHWVGQCGEIKSPQTDPNDGTSGTRGSCRC